MASKPRRASKSGLKVVGHIGTHQEVVEVLSQALGRAEEDETLAVALVEVRRGGLIEVHHVGQTLGFQHSLVAGAAYLMRDLCAEDEE